MEQAAAVELGGSADGSPLVLNGWRRLPSGQRFQGRGSANAMRRKAHLPRQCCRSSDGQGRMLCSSEGLGLMIMSSVGKHRDVAGQQRQTESW